MALFSQPTERLLQDLRAMHDSWSLPAPDEAANRYQRDLCGERYRIDPRGKYDVSTIAAPVCVDRETPVMWFVAGSIDSASSGAGIEEVARHMLAPAERVTRLASGQERPAPLRYASG